MKKFKAISVLCAGFVAAVLIIFLPFNQRPSVKVVDKSYEQLSPTEGKSLIVVENMAEDGTVYLDTMSVILHNGIIEKPDTVMTEIADYLK